MTDAEFLAELQSEIAHQPSRLEVNRLISIITDRTEKLNAAVTMGNDFSAAYERSKAEIATQAKIHREFKLLMAEENERLREELKKSRLDNLDMEEWGKDNLKGAIRLRKMLDVAKAGLVCHCDLTPGGNLDCAACRALAELDRLENEK